jgi:hypothetical protein
VQQILWDNAISYLARFLQPVSHPQSDDSLKMRPIVLSLLHSERVRASLDWERVRHSVSDRPRLAYKGLELKDLVLFPTGSMMSHDVLPIGFR